MYLVFLIYHFFVIVIWQVYKQKREIVQLQENVRDLTIKLCAVQQNSASPMEKASSVVTVPANINSNGTPNLRRQSLTIWFLPVPGPSNTDRSISSPFFFY